MDGLLIEECAELGLYGQTLCSFFDMTNDLGVDVERFANVDYVVCCFWSDVYLHSMPHVEHLIHLSPVGLARLVYGSEEWGKGEEVVFDNVAVVVYEV